MPTTKAELNTAVNTVVAGAYPQVTTSDYWDATTSAIKTPTNPDRLAQLVVEIISRGRNSLDRNFNVDLTNAELLEFWSDINTAIADVQTDLAAIKTAVNAKVTQYT